MEIDLSGKTILVVEDSDVNIMFFQSAFKRTGASVIVANDGDEAIEMVKQNPEISLILMDIKMPKRDGLSATKEIKKISPEIPVIIQTAYILNYDETKSYAAGCDYFLQKPIRLPELYDVISKMISDK